MTLFSSRFVGGPRDGEVHKTPGASEHYFAIPLAPVSMTSAEARTIMATSPEDRPRNAAVTARYLRRPRLERGQFVYDWESR